MSVRSAVPVYLDENQCIAAENESELSYGQETEKEVLYMKENNEVLSTKINHLIIIEPLIHSI
jgi:hypothetical protein